jgi:hypothetical protein
VYEVNLEIVVKMECQADQVQSDFLDEMVYQVHMALLVYRAFPE